MVKADPVTVRGLSGVSAAKPLTILERTDPAFVDAIYDQLSSTEGVAALAETEAHSRGQDGILRLYQPVHKVFHVALIDVSCDTLGGPRLNPDRIESAGIVIRRVATEPDGAPRSPEVLEGWMSSAQGVRGWAPVGSPEEASGRIDPDPERRRLPYAGPLEIRSRLAQLQGGIPDLAEAESPLFPAPPDVQKASRKTVFFGPVPLASSEFSAAPDQIPEYSNDEVASFLSPFLRASSDAKSIPRAGTILTTETATDPAVREQLREVITLAEQVDAQLDAFGSLPESAAVLQQLNRILLPLDSGGERPAGDFLHDFRDVAVLRDPGQVEMPLEWPRVSASTAAALLDAARAGAQGRLRSIASHEPRFGAKQALYRLRAFVRLVGEGDCPGKTIWSGYSERFRIVRWYEPGPGAPIPVELPDITSQSVRNLKPNVAFQVPESLFNTIKANDISKLLDGEGKEGGSGLGIGWICSLNLPVITICAFITLSIFLSLFDLFFRWLLFIKICLPYPKKK